jgi:hypothetical protein
MYIDSLTIAAMILIGITAVAIVWYCMVKVCGLIEVRGPKDDDLSSREKHA